MGLFGNREEKTARAAAAEAESERLRSLPVADLAAEILPAFGPDGMEAKSGQNASTYQLTRAGEESLASRAK
jgi:hypothetical protein